ncbi:MAG: DUF547 domain-containing protein [Parvularcula sp.]
MRAILLVAVSALGLAACETTSVDGAAGGDDGSLSAAVSGKSGEYSFPTTLGEAGAFSAFEPKPSGRKAAINYDVLSEALDIMVFNTGPSLRTVAKPRRARAGTRFVRGHDSQLRLEGNKIFFSQFDDDTIAAFDDYKKSLIDIGNRVDITELSRDEQLAYWYNLHNVLLINAVMAEYPVRVPMKMKIGPDKALLDDAKLATIRGVSLSLGDIRRNIVYRYWDDPIVMYGFFHGDLGSPNIRDEAYTGANVTSSLESNAREFINSLRGVRRGRDTTLISKHYFEARAGLFPEWPDDLRAHLLKYSGAEVSTLLLTNLPFAGAQYEERTADMVGGDPRLDILAGPTSIQLPPQLQELAIETGEKLLELRRQGKLRSKVTIVDLPGLDESEEDQASSDASEGSE